MVPPLAKVESLQEISRLFYCCAGSCKLFVKHFFYCFNISNLAQVRWEKYYESARTYNAKDGACRKSEQGNGPNRFQIPGIFVVCCQHGHVYGFKMMIDPEGRKDLFHLLYECFPQEKLDKLTVVCALLSFVEIHLKCRFMILLAML